ncbi:unnamed protein product [Trichobilharzia regenti]|nr:unnamed protein product [Trichobilharzia regenti]
MVSGQGQSSLTVNTNMEVFISELHVLMDCLLECLCYFLLNLQKQLQFKSSDTILSLALPSASQTPSSSSSSSLSPSLQFSPAWIQTLLDSLLDIESHLPMKYTDQYDAARIRLLKN